jgi:hypothetical protein
MKAYRDLLCPAPSVAAYAYRQSKRGLSSFYRAKRLLFDFHRAAKRVWQSNPSRLNGRETASLFFLPIDWRRSRNDPRRRPREANTGSNEQISSCFTPPI